MWRALLWSGSLAVLSWVSWRNGGSWASGAAAGAAVIIAAVEIERGRDKVGSVGPTWYPPSPRAFCQLHDGRSTGGAVPSCTCRPPVEG